MNLVRNLKGKRWKIDGILGGRRTLKQGTRKGEIWEKNERGVETLNLILTAGAQAPNHLKLIPIRIQAPSISSRILIVLSDCPSIWGWKVVLSSKHIPKASWKAFQKWVVNWGPEFGIMDMGIPMQSNYFINIHLCILSHTVSGFHWKKMGRFSQSINNHPDGIEFLRNPRQPSNKIYSNSFPFPFQCLYLLVKISWSLMLRLNLLKY